MNTFQENFEHNLNTIKERLNLKENIGLTSYYSSNNNLVAHFDKIEYYKYLNMVFLTDMMGEYKAKTIDLTNNYDIIELLENTTTNGFSVDDNVMLIHIVNYKNYNSTMTNIIKKMINNVSGKVFIIKW